MNFLSLVALIFFRKLIDRGENERKSHDLALESSRGPEMNGIKTE